ncbi:glycosyltransferase family 2 protein [Candidatus Gottesmanbacteria bacterium]|nr:glycosyltransferase family 2 protein [Candidatus Gottesmanbacteria bacterium]
MKHVAIVIVNWNGKKDTLECLASVEKLEREDVQLDVIVVDNGSRDNSVSAIREKFPRTILIEKDTNLGFSGGNNAGILYALKKNANAVWLLNNDTIVHRHALIELTRANGDIVGSKIYFERGYEYHKNRYARKDRGKVIWYTGGVIDWQNMYASHRGVDEVDHGQYDAASETDFVTGCSMMVRSEVFMRIGDFDERYYLYLEDVDLCLRARRAGFETIYVPGSIVWHKNAGSSGGAGSSLHDYYLMRNRFLLGFRYAPMRTKIALLRQAFTLLFGTSRQYRRAALDALTGRWGKQYEPKRDND